MSPQSIIFDFDGVLVESVAVKGTAFGALYADHGPEFQQQVVEYHEAHGGVSRFDKIRYYEEQLLGRSVTEGDIKNLAQRFSDIVEEQVVACPAVAGALKFLEENHARLPLFVASATPQEELERIVSKRSMSVYFRGVYGSPASKAQNIKSVLETYRYDADRTFMIGDTMSDFKGAKEAGVKFIGRVAAGNKSPFPEGTKFVQDLTALQEAVDGF